MKLLELKNEEYHMTSDDLHLSKEALLVPSYHSTWRTCAMGRIFRKNSDDFFYSGVFTSSHKDYEKIRKMLIELQVELRQIISKSSEETVICMNTDFFKLQY